MGIRTYFYGIVGGDFSNLVNKRGLGNPYTTYGFLNNIFKQAKEGKDLVLKGPIIDQIVKNLEGKLLQGKIRLEELVEGGAATNLFKAAGLFQTALNKLSVEKAVELDISGNEGKLRRFLLSGKKSVPYVIEHLPAEKIAEALSAASKAVKQRSVIGLMLTNQARYSGMGTVDLKMEFDMQYDERPIITGYFPYNVQKMLCFDRTAEKDMGADRGVILEGNLVKNIKEILDALSRQKISPLDHMLICLKMIQGYGTPRKEFPFLNTPELDREEFVGRDHFTDRARETLTGAIDQAINELGGNRGQYALLFDRQEREGKQKYIVQIASKEKLQGFNHEKEAIDFVRK